MTLDRKFEDKVAVREQVPLLIGLVSPSGGGKTFSALRLAAGIQRVSGGEVFFMDSEAKRALAYAERFKFRHVPFAPPFSPSDYGAAIRHCLDRGAKTICIDSMSHEHAGQGGVLEWHDAEIERLARGDSGKADRVGQLAWQKPKADRMRLINQILQAQCNFIFCFRAKERLEFTKGKEPVQMGWMPIGGEEYWFEMTTRILLLPNSNGVPTWESRFPGEQMVIKLPEQFRKDIFPAGQALSEETGEKMAKWAAGGAATQVPKASASTGKEQPSPSSQTNGSTATQSSSAPAGKPDAKLSAARNEFAKAWVKLGLPVEKRLSYCRWCTGKSLESSEAMTIADWDVCTRRADLGEVPDGELP